MDWFSWLSKTGLDSSVVYDYSLSFARNELEEDDAVYFNHEFLQSMGISIAKHRLEIIKLSNKLADHKTTSLRPVKKLLLVAIKRTKRCLEKCLNTIAARLGSADHGSSSALVVVQTQTQRLIPKRDKKSVVAKHGRLMLTNGSPVVVSSGRSTSRVNSFASPLVYNHKTVEDHHQDGYWSNGVEVIRWDTLFQDLKPT